MERVRKSSKEAPGPPSFLLPTQCIPPACLPSFMPPRIPRPSPTQTAFTILISYHGNESNKGDAEPDCGMLRGGAASQSPRRPLPALAASQCK
ncbi:hypothetical protein E2C01_044308 [Portunus trituberculatus]|uniref:Uncharacterized protein n=1 Tax=Portunus trituberculatus TaxID=210409 RepID=A0A5B7FYZ0_PORTR|nr:hypothetical protein [Portunus trituberculatus]